MRWHLQHTWGYYQPWNNMKWFSANHVTFHLRYCLRKGCSAHQRAVFHSNPQRPEWRELPESDERVWLRAAKAAA